MLFVFALNEILTFGYIMWVILPHLSLCLPWWLYEFHFTLLSGDFYSSIFLNIKTYLLCSNNVLYKIMLKNLKLSSNFIVYLSLFFSSLHFCKWFCFNMAMLKIILVLGRLNLVVSHAATGILTVWFPKK